jgi:predicted DNA-binding helix-hairpin-helix protein
MERQSVIAPATEEYPWADLDTPDAGGGCGRLLKVLLDDRCSYDCAYCGVRARRGGCSATPAGIADTFLRMHREGKADGLFLSSGIAGDVDLAMEGIVETGEILRRRGFRGYLHLKVLPGASRADITDAARVASRISINIEAPSASRLSEVAGVKDYRCDIEKRQAWVAEAMPGRHTTQLVVGAAGESDAEILSCISRQYGRLAPARVYYSAFTPVAGTPLECREAAPLWRQRRLYQVDALVHLYHVSPDAIRDVMDDDGFLPDADPKRVLAEDLSPVDINTAPLADLLRVPGIGPVGARRICAMRRKAPLVSPADLRKCGVCVKDAGPFVRFGREVQARLSSF